MLILITGGAGSGKSLLAENLCSALKKESLYYIATMQIWDEECRQRIIKHRKQREGKDFINIECPFNLFETAKGFNSDFSALLECMSNLVANEMFSNNNKNAVNDILKGISFSNEVLENLIIVSNEIFDDYNSYTPETFEYIENMGRINCAIADMADIVIEVVCGIPIIHKGGMLYNQSFD